MNEQNNPILEVKNLRVSYHTYAGEVKAVRGVQFSLEKGQALAIVGESGCGKSVTAKSIMGLIKAPQGEIKENSEILYHGENILKYNKKQWQHYKGGECAIIFQDALASLNPTMRVGKQIMENLMGHKNMTKQEAAKEAVEMLRMVGIPEPEKRVRQYPHEFSGGMRQRGMIAIAFACDPKILICDEPTTALDVTIQGQILDIIKNLQKKNQTSVIMITHDLGVVPIIAQKNAVMKCTAANGWKLTGVSFNNNRTHTQYSTNYNAPNSGASSSTLRIGNLSAKQSAYISFTLRNTKNGAIQYCTLNTN